ncbi:MAG TPA: MCE family protein, partial [Marmoricola sp.]|nr:MCE family protein [Marmoricola sp.]
GQSSALNTLLEHAGSVTNTLGDRQVLVGQVIRNLNTVSGTFDQRRDTVAQLIDQLSSLVQGLQGQDTQVLNSAAKIDTFARDAASLISAARGSLQPDLVNLAKVAKGVNSKEGTLIQVLQKLPKHYAAIQDTASYGNFFNFFLCGVRVETGTQNLPVITPWIMSDVPRCKG